VRLPPVALCNLRGREHRINGALHAAGPFARLLLGVADTAGTTAANAGVSVQNGHLRLDAVPVFRSFLDALEFLLQHP